MKRGALWPLGIAAILTLTVGANIALYAVAGDDPSFAIEPDYYAKAVAWDSTMAQATRNAALGWHIAPSLAPFTKQGARLTAALVDSTSTRIGGARVIVSAVYVARAGTVFTDTLAADGDGYSGILPVAHAGQWELRFDVTRGTDRFTATARVDAIPSP
jgi:hypothetical protein